MSFNLLPLDEYLINSRVECPPIERLGPSINRYPIIHISPLFPLFSLRGLLQIAIRTLRDQSLVYIWTLLLRESLHFLLRLKLTLLFPMLVAAQNGSCLISCKCLSPLRVLLLLNKQILCLFMRL
jgi:hypothetical protein